MAQRGAQGRPRAAQGRPGPAKGRPRGTPARGKQLYIQTHVPFFTPGRFEHRFEELINALCVIFPCGSFSDFQDFAKIVISVPFEHRFEELINAICAIFPCGSFSDFQDFVKIDISLPCEHRNDLSLRLSASHHSNGAIRTTPRAP